MLKDTLHSRIHWSKKNVIKKVKNTVPWTYIINDVNGEGIIGTFYEKELQKTNQEEFRTEKIVKEGNKLYVNGKVTIVHLITGLIKKTLYKNRPIFSKLHEPFEGDINVIVNLSNYATKKDIKNISYIDTLSFPQKSN